MYQKNNFINNRNKRLIKEFYNTFNLNRDPPCVDVTVRRNIQQMA